MTDDRSVSAEVTAEAIGRTLPEAKMLDILARASPKDLKAIAEDLLSKLPPPKVLQSRTGLVLLPRQDSVTGTPFHLGEVMIAEAHIQLDEGGVEGYGAIMGRDLDHAMAMAVVDAAIAAGKAPQPVYTFLGRESARQTAEDAATLAKVEATRVEMEAF